MNGSKLIVTVLLIGMIAAGWGAAFLGIMDGSEKEQTAMAEYKECIEMAEEYSGRGLYQKAIVQYENAVAQENKEEDWAALLVSYEARYKEDDEIIKDYIKAAKKAVREYSKNTSFYEILTAACIEDEDYKTAYSFLEKAVEDGTKDETILALYEKVRYACSLESKSYLEFRSLCNGNYAVSNQGTWGLMSDKNKMTAKCKYTMVGNVSEEKGMYVFSDGIISGIMDEEDVLQGKFTFIPEAAGIYAEELMPIQCKGTWAYYNLLGDLQFGEYQAAGTFQDGKAAVKIAEGWVLINKKGEVESDVYEEIRLNPDGTYIKEDVMLAKKEGSWHLFNEKEKMIGSFSCEDIDIVTEDELIAFKQNGKWGFVDLEGEVVIEATYDQAKSFSEGLAAVHTNNFWGFINEDNKVVIKPAYLNADYFNEKGGCMVQTTVNSWQVLTRYINE